MSAVATWKSVLFSTVGTVLASSFLYAAPASASDPWTTISQGTVSTIARPSVARSGDSLLRVLYPTESGSLDTYSLTSLTPAGSLSSTVPVLSNLDLTLDPQLLINGSTFRAVHSWLSPSGEADARTGRMIETTSTDSGATWTQAATYTLGVSSSAYASYGTAATLLADGSVMSAFPLNSDIYLRSGGPIALNLLAPTVTATPDTNFNVGSCCAYNLNLARSGDAVWLAWYQNGNDEASSGTFVRQVAPTLGPVLKAPMSSEGASSSDRGHVPMVVRPDGSVYLAYCAGYIDCPMAVWRVGAAAPTIMKGSEGARRLSLAVAADGRLWASWVAEDWTVQAARSDTAAARFGTIVSVPQTAAVSAIESNAGVPGQLDVVINDTDHQQLRHARILPGLSLRLSPSRWSGQRPRTVRAKVTDGIVAVAGVRVAGGGKSCTTTAAGRCTLRFGPSRPRTITITAGATGWVGASEKATITR